MFRTNFRCLVRPRVLVPRANASSAAPARLPQFASVTPDDIATFEKVLGLVSLVCYVICCFCCCFFCTQLCCSCALLCTNIAPNSAGNVLRAPADDVSAYTSDWLVSLFGQCIFALPYSAWLTGLCGCALTGNRLHPSILLRSTSTTRRRPNAWLCCVPDPPKRYASNSNCYCAMQTPRWLSSALALQLTHTRRSRASGGGRAATLQ